MNGYVEAGYGVVIVALGAYGAWLAARGSRLRRALVPIPVDQERPEQPKD